MHLNPCKSFSVSKELEPSNNIGLRFSRFISSPSFAETPLMISLEEGIRLDTEMNYPLTVTTEKICVTNVSNLIAQIKLLGYVKKSI